MYPEARNILSQVCFTHNVNDDDHYVTFKLMLSIFNNWLIQKIWWVSLLNTDISKLRQQITNKSKKLLIDIYK